MGRFARGVQRRSDQIGTDAVLKGTVPRQTDRQSEATVARHRSLPFVDFSLIDIQAMCREFSEEVGGDCLSAHSH